MTLVASLLFLFALAASVMVIAATIGSAMPRIKEVVEMEFGPEVRIERQVTFGTVKQRRAQLAGEIVVFPRGLTAEPEYRLAA